MAILAISAAPTTSSTIVEAMTILQERARGSPSSTIAALAEQILFVFVGGGAQRAKLEREILKRKLTNVRLHPYQPRELLAETLGVADVHLVSLNPKLEGLIVPSKFYGIAAAGRPTLFIGAADGEIARLIDEFECGFTINSGRWKRLSRPDFAAGARPSALRHSWRPRPGSLRKALGQKPRGGKDGRRF